MISYHSANCHAASYVVRRCLNAVVVTYSTSPSSLNKLSDIKVCAFTPSGEFVPIDVPPYEEMVDYMKRLATHHTELHHEERSYFSVAYKNLIGARRTSWRILGSTLNKEDAKGNWEEVEMIKRYRKKIEGELTVDCLDCIDTVKKHLIPYAFSSESKVFWRKMFVYQTVSAITKSKYILYRIGDYHRYLAEIAPEEQRKISYDGAYEAYTVAMDMAPKDLAPTNPVRLGVQLSFAVYYFEIQKKPHLACSMAQKAFDDAITRLETLTEDNYRESTLIMQLLRDNLTMWKAQMEDGE
jgi:14-3-3 protein epsilon